MMQLIVRTFSKHIGGKEFQDKVYRLDVETGKFEPEISEELRSVKDSINEVIFITGNKNKLAELEASLLLDNVKLSCPETKLDLIEIQDADVLNIVQDKCQRACERLQEDCHQPNDFGAQHTKVVLVEDSCLNFEALCGMPGPYVKWFLDAIGPEGLCRMLTGFNNKTAEAICIYALMLLSNVSTATSDDSSLSTSGMRTVLFFHGVARGQIVEPRRKDPAVGWGWDPVFEEQRSRLTFAEMEPSMKSKFSHRAAALEVLKAFFKT